MNKILKAEENVIRFLENKMIYIYLVVALLVSLAIRYFGLPFISGDMSTFLIGWYGQIEQLGQIHALNTQVGNYNVLYQTIIAILTYLPGDPIVKYKAVSIIFDYVVSVGVFLLIYDKEKKNSKFMAILGAIITVFSPIVFLNSSVWGQCDSIYISFIILSLVAYKKEKPALCMIFFGLAFAFKLQAIFYLPFHLFEWFRKKSFSILNFLLVPLTMIVVCIPAYINGRGFWGFISPYYYQTGSCDKMSFNYQSFWTILSDSREKRLEYISTMKVPAVLITFLILLSIMTWLIYRKKELNERGSLYLAFLLAFTCVEFLPGMHERYGFGVEILSIVLAFKDKRTIPLAIALNILTMITYGAELFGGVMNITILGIINFAIYLTYMYFFYRNLRGIVPNR
ncbi:MAG: glycosyltransferase 87 family protein [Lachnospiraceae bacterium]|nr:glycosyltransferase 87 family protein [Lachnospiraceae bacterium]